MTYKLGFLVSALKEWRKLDADTRETFKKKLKERLENPRVPSARLSGRQDRYKIKLRGVGYRLVYEVQDARVIAVGKRERDAVYKAAEDRSGSDRVAPENEGHRPDDLMGQFDGSCRSPLMAPCAFETP